MARISTYTDDNSINDNDRLIGTDGGRIGDDGMVVAGTAGATKNFLLEDIRTYVLGGGDDGMPGDHENEFRYETNTVNGGVEALSGYTVNVLSAPGVKMLPQEPRDGEWVKIIDLTSRNQRVMLHAGMGRRFMNDTRDMNSVLILDSGTSSFELVYVGKQAGGGTSEDIADHVGWVIVGAQTTES